MKYSKPFFQDVTLRDGNQALPKPWNQQEKEKVFKRIIELGIQGAEVGFASASDTDFASCRRLAEIAPESITIASLSRANEKEITLSWDAIKYSARPRIHIVFPVSRNIIENVIRTSKEDAIQKVSNAIRFARSLAGGRGTVQFSGEHFGECRNDLEYALDFFEEAVSQGADVINFPNTVERFRPFEFIRMLSAGVERFKNRAVLSVHTHNDLGMATATTVESFFAGVVQMETTLGGLGERAGNTNFFEVACALHNCGIETGINYHYISDTAEMISEMSGIPVHPKAPLVGSEVFSHRSGIHQDGVAKTIKSQQNAYGTVSPEFIGRKDGHKIRFTSQSGKSAIQYMLESRGIEITEEQARKFQPILKKISEENGELDEEKIAMVLAEG